MAAPTLGGDGVRNASVSRRVFKDGIPEYGVMRCGESSKDGGAFAK